MEGMVTKLFTLQAHPLEGLFFGSGKAPVVLGVLLIMLLGFVWWMWRTEKRVQRMEDSIQQHQKAKSSLD